MSDFYEENENYLGIGFSIPDDFQIIEVIEDDFGFVEVEIPYEKYGN